MSRDTYSKIGMERSEDKKKKKGLFSRFFGGADEAGENPEETKGGEDGMRYPDKPSNGNPADEKGKVKEVDVTSNKFTIPDREKKPLPDKEFPYKGKLKKRYIAINQ